MHEPLEILEHFISHYQKLGASQICLFLDDDNPTQTARELARFPQVVTQVSRRHRPQPSRADCHEEEQVSNFKSYIATAQDIEWCGHVDADELLMPVGNPDNHTLSDLLGEHEDVVAITFPSMEAIYTEGDDINERFSQSAFRIPFSADFAAKQPAIYPGATRFLTNGLAGHTGGKTFLRPRAKVASMNVHRPFLAEGNCITHHQFFRLAHYDAISFNDWTRKLNRRISGDVVMSRMRPERIRQLEAFRSQSGDPHALLELFKAIYFLEQKQVDRLMALGAMRFLHFPVS